MNTEQSLKNCRVAILATDGFEQSELLEPKSVLQDCGANVSVVAPQGGEIKAWNHTNWGKAVKVDAVLGSVNPEDFDALLLPGGVMNPDKLRINERAIAFIQSFVDAGKPIAAICHGPWPLIETGMVRGRRITSWPSLKSDLRNAGADWVDEPVVTDQGLVTSRKPEDIPAFMEKVLEEFAEGTHSRDQRPARSA